MLEKRCLSFCSLSISLIFSALAMGQSEIETVSRTHGKIPSSAESKQALATPKVDTELCRLLSDRSEGLSRPNVLFISLDDLNDWVGVLQGHPQAQTPNLDRLFQSGMLFTNAHCAAPSCNPSRTAVMTGIPPNLSGLYRNDQPMREVLPNAQLLPAYFTRHGYWSAGSGKILHYLIDAKSWDEYFPNKDSENPFPRTLYPKSRPVSLPRGGPWQYVETDWGPLDATDVEYGGDYLVAEWIGKQLGKQHDKPFFLACGIYRPHEPWFVPKKYFEQFPLESIKIPPGYKPDDLDDLPDAGKRQGPNRYFEHIRKHGQWKKAIQGYLASIAFADAMAGKVIHALESGPNADNTIVVAWSDHGWHLGEKQHWQKYSPWRVCTRVPLFIRVPNQAPGLPGGTEKNVRCNQPVNLVSLYSTLTELAGLPKTEQSNAPSLVPLLKNPKSDWPYVSSTFLSDGQSVALSARRFRYIRYRNNDEEFYDIDSDPYEWNNLAKKSEYEPQLERFRKLLPKQFKELKAPSVESLPKLKWQVAELIPKSKPDGSPFECYFTNRSKDPVKLFWMDRVGSKKLYGEIAPGTTRQQRTRPGAIWMIADEEESPLGFFRIGDRAARGIVPAR